METFVPNDKVGYYSGITSITVNGKNAYELKGKFLDDLHNNDFRGTNGKDAFEHIEYYLKIIDPIRLPNVDNKKLRIVVFPISLAGGARRWFDRTKESITCWVDLTANFFRKYYPPSCIEGNNTPVIKWDPANPRFEDYEWYEALEDSELKDNALKNKAIMEGLISDDESSNDCWKRWKNHKIYYHDYNEGEYENETHEEGHELCSIKTREVPICQIKRYKMIKYSFNDEEEYFAVKEDEYNDLTITSDEACRAYQEIFRMMDEGWMVTRTEREAKEKSNLKTSL
ncbi:hypothetical protein Tco_0430858 [Tanacetum coccineum]